MFKPLSLFIGLRYVRSRHGNGFSSFISASSTIGIALGVMVLIVVLSAMNGFQRELANSLLSVVPHGEYLAVSGKVSNWPAYVENAKQHEHVVAAAPVIKLAGMVSKGDIAKGVEIRGVDSKLEQTVSSIATYINAGSWQAIDNKNTIILGMGAANKLNLQVGDKLQLLLPRQGQGNQLTAPISRRVTLVATFKFGAEIDNSLAFMNMEQAANIVGLRDEFETQVHGIRIKVDDVFNAPAIVRQVGQGLFYAYMHDWTYSQGHLFNDIQLVRMVMFIVLIVVIAVASFNIVSSLIMAVNERKSDIAILKTMGATRMSIMFSFMIQGLVNGVIGCTVGGTLGILIALYLTDIVGFIEQLLQVQFLSDGIYFVDFLPTELNNSDVIITVSVGLILSLLATIYPSWQATKIEPAKVLGQV